MPKRTVSVAIQKVGIILSVLVVLAVPVQTLVLNLTSSESVSALGSEYITPNNGSATGGENVTIIGDGVGLEHKNIKQVAAGFYDSAAIDSEGGLYTWGYNNYSQIGNGSTAAQTSPLKLNGLAGSAITATTKIVKVSIAGHALAVDDEGNLYAWGYNAKGQIGNNSTTTVTKPVLINGGALAGGVKIVDVAVGDGHSLAVDDQGNLYAWGYNRFGQVGDGSAIDQLVPVNISAMGVLNGKNVVDIAAGLHHSVALDEEGVAYTWGMAAYGGALMVSATPSTTCTDGTATWPCAKSPAVATALSAYDVKDIAASYYTTMALASDGNLYMAGVDDLGQNGLGNTVGTNGVVACDIGVVTKCVNQPVKVNGAVASGDIKSSTVLTHVYAGMLHTMAKDTEGNVYAWGLDQYGALGDGASTANHATCVFAATAASYDCVTAPNKIAIPSNGADIDMMAGGQFASLAVDASGVVYTWGRDNLTGQLGNGDALTADTNSAASIMQYGDFVASVSVAFDGVAATNVTRVDDNTITATTPAHGVGAVDVVVTSGNGTAVYIAGFTYGFNVTNITPDMGPEAGGTQITITGSGFGASAPVAPFVNQATPEDYATANSTVTPYSTYTAPYSGNYKLEVWGAQGGAGITAGNGGKGGYATGTVYLNAGDDLYIYVGAAGANSANNNNMAAGGYNGGGGACRQAGTGGGATDIRTTAGAWNLTASLNSRLVVAGSGGGGAAGAANGDGGDGGGSTGIDGKYATAATNGKGGTSTAGGAAGSGSNSNDPTPGTSGAGGDGARSGNNCAGAGGGGYYGGGGGAGSQGGGGGGSGYVAPSLTSASTVAGNVSFVAPGGGSETGHAGAGYARITPPPEVYATYAVEIDGAECVVDSWSDTQVKCTTSAHEAGTYSVDVVIDGAKVSVGEFDYVHVYSLAISGVSPVGLQITPTPQGNLVKESTSVTVTTDNPAGYSMYISMDGEDQRLVMDETHYFGSASGTFSVPTVLEKGTWGFNMDNSNNFAAVPVNSALQKIKQTSIAAPAGDATSITFGAKADMSVVSGEYTGMVRYTVMAN